MALVEEYQYTNCLLFEDKELLDFAREFADVGMKERMLGTIHQKAILEPQRPPVTIEEISAKVGTGVFAAEDLPADLYIGEYTGIVRRASSLNPPNDYSFKYPVQDSIGRYLEINGEPWGNFTRLINHSYTPNLISNHAYLDGIYHAIFLTAKPISAGTQLTYNYGTNYWSLRGDPTPL